MGKERGVEPLHHLIEEQAARTPHAPAIVDDGMTLTYRMLDHKSRALASRLAREGVVRGTPVGVYMERCAEYVVACLAAMKAGGAFLPLELAYPESLLAEVLEDCRPPVVLTRERHAGRLPREQKKLCAEDGWDDPVGEPPDPRTSLQDPCFIAYSSGTTGRPKGVVNPHRAAVRSYLWRLGVSDYRPGDRVGCNVFFVWEVFRPLLRGATSYVIPDDVIYDPAALISYLEENCITETLMTPSLLGTVLSGGGEGLSGRLSSLRTLWLNGEVVTKKLAQSALSALPNTRIMNVYSISETHEVAAGDLQDLLATPDTLHCPVGQPMAPDRLYVLDEAGRPVPRGEPGELYVGGECLAHGYVERPELTASRFVADPFRGDGSRMYRSGDRARLLPDGKLEILGRCDSMQKVRGYSVELGAVEAAIERELAVSGCVAVVDGEEGEDKRLVAYLVPAPPEEHGGRYAGWRIDPNTGRSPEIRERLGERLPHYMVPGVFVELDSLPLQKTSGKVDRGKLPAPPPRESGRRPLPKRIPPGASPEEKRDLVISLWEDLLGFEQGEVHPEDDFFELGGHSLAAAELMGALEETFGVRIAVSEFLEDPTPVSLIRRLEAPPGEAMHLDLRAEARLDGDIFPAQPGARPVLLREAENVFLTGATGFLGAFLLEGLLSRTRARIHCLVRPRGAEDLEKAIEENLEGYGLWHPDYGRRIVAVSGDLEQPFFGMGEADFEHLARGVDLIIHAGARVNLLYPYRELAGANVSGTREVLRLACLAGATPVHHVSTNGIFPDAGRVCREDEDLDALAGARPDGYGQSKWVAEKLVRQAAERGLPVSVYRPGNISGHSESGASNPHDLLTTLLAGSLQTGLAPRAADWSLEMSPVDFVAGAILQLADDPEAIGGTFHLANPDPVEAEKVFDWLEEAGHPLERVPLREWLEELRTTGQGGALLAMEEYGLRDDNTYDDAAAQEALARSSLRRPATDARLIGRYADHLAGQEKSGAGPLRNARRRA
ncbi:MAG: non-ribosomal peptide synthetase [Rubrobacteraceae bacterium]|nr:non-ribosomal peptide synthetase [Rubrobacteraceae bacterium]